VPPPRDDREFAYDIVDNLNAGAIVLDRNLLIVTMNPAAEDLLGISRHRAHRRSLLKLVDDDRQLQDILGRVTSTGLTFADELQLGPTDVHTERRVVDCRVSLMQGAQTGGCLLVEMSDVTRRSRISRGTANDSPARA
jgi:PAS domain S-box-containing protein